jgi:hypothetical protein
LLPRNQDSNVGAHRPTICSMTLNERTTLLRRAFNFRSTAGLFQTCSLFQLPSRLFVPVCIALFVLICFPLFTNNLPYLDDAYLIQMQRQDGFWTPTISFQSMWGSYRLIYTTLMSPVYSLGEHLWFLRTIGLTLHIGNAALLGIITARLGWRAPTRALMLAMFLFFPYSLEAIAWPANVTQYPFAPFLMLSGVALILSPSGVTSKMLCGAVLLGVSAWIHEQVGPLIVLLLGVVVAGLPRKKAIPIAATALAIVAANFILIFATRGSNLRLTGPNAGSLRNALGHLDYVPQVFRTTPLGDLYYWTGGISKSPAFWAAIAATGLLLLFAALRPAEPAEPDELPTWSEPKWPWFLPLTFALTVGAYLVSLVPILMTPTAWHTARVVYIPFLAFTLALSIGVEIVQRLTFDAKAARLAIGCSAVLALGWNALALRAETNAFDFQVRVNHQRVQALNAAIGREIFEGKTAVVVGGYFDADHQRPLFGEHFTSVTVSEIEAGLGIRVNDPPPYPNVVAQAHWSHVCATPAGRIEFQLPNDAVSTAVVAGADRVIYAMWARGQWRVQRPDEGRSDPIASFIDIEGRAPSSCRSDPN